MNQRQNYRFFSHPRCEYFPCHSGIDPEQFNCLFCYCPLYVLDGDCGGQFTYTADGVKDCSACLLPHRPEGYDRLLESWPKLLALMNERREKRTDL